MSHDPRAQVGEVTEVLARHQVLPADLVVIVWPQTATGWSSAAFIYPGNKAVAKISGMYSVSALLEVLRDHGYRRVRVAPKQEPGRSLCLADLRPLLVAA